MAQSESDSHLMRLESLLIEERAALLSGNLERVATLLPAKENLMDLVSEEGALERASLRTLSETVAHNQKLLASAAEGVKTVTERLKALQRVRDSLETYGADGKRRNIDTESNGTVERRA